MHGPFPEAPLRRHRFEGRRMRQERRVRPVVTRPPEASCGALGTDGDVAPNLLASRTAEKSQAPPSMLLSVLTDGSTAFSGSPCRG